MKEQRLASLLRPILADLALELEAVDVTSAGSRRILRVVVDGDGPRGAGPTLDEVAEASRAISAKLDESDAMGAAPYNLEVGTRGVSLPLKTTRHFRRNRGRLVKCWTTEGEVVGRIADVDDARLRLDLAPGERVLERSSISKAVVQVELNPPAEREREA